MNKFFRIGLGIVFLIALVAFSLPSYADMGASLDAGQPVYTQKIRKLTLRSVAKLTVRGNPQNPVIEKNGHFALIPAKDINVVYYLAFIRGRSVLLRHTIPTGKGPVDAVITGNSKKAYVANELDNTVSVIRLNGENSYLESTIQVGNQPCSLALSKNGQYLYVVNRGEDSLYVVDTYKLGYPVINKISVGEWPNSIKISKNGKSAFVVNRGGNSITEIDLVNPKGSILKEDIIVGTYPIDVALSSDSNIGLVSNGLDKNIGIFSPVEASRVMFGNIDGVDKPLGIESDYNQNIAVAVSFDDSKIHFFDLSNTKEKIVSELKHDPVIIWDKPEYLALNTKSGIIIVSHPEHDNLSIVKFKIVNETIKLEPVVKEVKSETGLPVPELQTQQLQQMQQMLKLKQAIEQQQQLQQQQQQQQQEQMQQQQQQQEQQQEQEEQFEGPSE